ncbi:uncharacterized protein LOC109860437 isoform X2 [Pseudomyrmex gracilis]|uniref:uncharacterized protein LOC109860437 isoform X2 n=1 Tax=Pseudomyrmex gracilis TaxID=219809 RepID=UPI000995D5E2|nr:uncharacterized protein LOC109860437 isoform X2 [Pseudomyrmex gracilis]
MPSCLSSSMTGSTDAGLLQPQEDPKQLSVSCSSSTFNLRPVSEDTSSLLRRGRSHRQPPRRRMTSAPPPGQTIQLTPLWEHVVRTRKFPSEVDAQATFVEISERLRDPEWEVRQHALRVLVDVLPTLNADVDKVMQPVVPELINNLGHPAPAVRKGALDTLRVYLIHSPNRDSMVKSILHDGLNRPDAHNPFQINVTTGVILSAPLLLFPSSNSPPPTTQILKDATIAFASRLVQIPHQEAVLKSLIKIRDAVGEEEFDNYLADYDDKFKKNIDVLAKIYSIKPNKRKRDKSHSQEIVKTDKKECVDKFWDSDSDTSGIAEEEDEASNSGSGAMPPARVVLETEIKFNEETAITMTILEEKDEDDSEDNERRNTETENNANNNKDFMSLENKRKTSRRVHFGGEIVKLRTPDSDETESIEVDTPKTRIPLPVSPATKMPETMRRRPSSQPCSPHAEKRCPKRASRSASNSPKREYTHNAQLSPKKSILTRTGGERDPLIVIDPAMEENAKKNRKSGEAIVEDEGFRVTNSSEEVSQVTKKEEVTLIRATSASLDNREKLIKNNESNETKDENHVFKVTELLAAEPSKNTSVKEKQMIYEKLTDTIDKTNISEMSLSSQEKTYTPIQFIPRGQTLKEENRDDISIVEEGRSSEQNPVKSNFSCEFPFGSPVNECNTQIDRFFDSDFGNNDRQDVCTFNVIKDDRVTTTVADYCDGKVVIGESNCEGRKAAYSQSDIQGAMMEGNESVTCSSSEGEGKPQESNWEELGLVSQEVLDDLHNKDDWRARVRGLERVASALRTSSALIAIESRLGSLLHAVLGGERSCRVAAAGLAVAKVIVTGVSEDALKKKLPQLAWGLARQGGPAAAQLARIAMLRLKPSLLLEQFLQPHCLNARNAKTRENTLQLLIFSLVTFPSTEFKLQTVANHVTTMIMDRRRRVRQAALDTLAVLGQIYNSEEVLEAGKRAAEGCTDGEAMLAAIRARLARKSLPLVSVDGLVVYGLQISPTVQIATGPDVDWIVAGSGSVSPGTGRTRGQIIATSRSAQGKVSRNEINNRESPWIERSNLVALGVGLQSKTEQSMAWQILSSQTNNDIEHEIKRLNGRNLTADVSLNGNLKFEEQLRSSYTPSNQLYDSVRTDYRIRKEISNNYFEQKTRNRKDINELAKEKESAIFKGESKIPILSMRERYKIILQNREKSINLENFNFDSQKQTKNALNSNRNRINLQQDTGSYAAIYQRRKRLHLEESQSSNQTFDSHYSNCYPPICTNTLATSKEYSDIIGSRETIFSDDNSNVRLSEFVDCENFSDKTENSSCTIGRQRSLSRNMQQSTLVETYSSIYEQQRKLTDRNAYRLLRIAANPPTYMYQESQDLSSPISANDNRNVYSKQRLEMVSSNSQENGHFFAENFPDPHRRRLRSLSPSQLHRSKQFVKLASSRFHATSMYDIDKTSAVNEEEYNTQNKRHFSPETYHVHTVNKEESRYQVGERARECSKSASSSSSDVSRNDQQNAENREAALQRDYNGNDNSESSTPRSRDGDNPAFDVITQQTANHPKDDVDSFFIPLNTNKIEYPVKTVPTVDEASKEWNSEYDTKPTSRIGSILRHSNHNELNESSNRNSSDVLVQPTDDKSSARRKSTVTVIPDKLTYEDPEIYKESLQTRAASPKKSELLYQSPNDSAHHSPSSNSPSKQNSHYSRNSTRDSNKERIIASIVPDEDASIRSLDTVGHLPVDTIDDSPAIVIASRPHSHEAVKYVENSRSVDNSNLQNKISVQESTEEESSVNDTLEDKQSKDSASETNTEPGILKIESEPVETVESRRRLPSKVPVRGVARHRAVSNKRITEKPSEISKRMMQQCLSQLENKDWEITMKGLKTLSQLSKQHPEYLDVCVAGTLGRLLGRHVKNLRSQVARAACNAASDVFSSQIRGIDQDLDDIAGPLLHRTADTNRFLRADSNAALDQMIQHLPPYKTIGIIVLRGASHQNSVVRAATARLLSDITDRIGPDHIMILPRDVRDKLLNTGAKLLMDGNLDARNHAKRMFRRLTLCDGFRKALTDAVPETTLRHIDKTMKTL